MGSDFLFARPSFLQGMGSVLDVMGTAEEGNYNHSRTRREADYRATVADWLAVGSDLFESCEAIRRDLVRQE